MAVKMRVHCTVCRYTWDRNIQIEDEDIVCPACGNSQENFDADELERIEGIQKRQGFFAFIATLAIVGGALSLAMVAVTGRPENTIAKGTIPDDYSKADLSSRNAAALAVVEERLNPNSNAVDKLPDGDVKKLAVSLKDNARIIIKSDEDRKLQETITEDVGAVPTVPSFNKVSQIDPIAAKLLKMPSQTINTPVSKMYLPAYSFDVRPKITNKIGGLSSGQFIFAVLGSLLLLAGLIIGYPAQGKRWIAEI